MEKKNKKCKVDLCTRLVKSQKKHHGYCARHFTEQQNALRDLTNFEPTILPPAKKPNRTSQVNGNKNLFVYEESVVRDFLELAATGEIPNHIQAINSQRLRINVFFKVLHYNMKLSTSLVLAIMEIFGMLETTKQR